MAQIQVNDLTFSYDGSADDVLREVTFSIDTDWKLGLPHKSRRTLATMAIDKGMPIEQVQHLLGHQSLDTTLQYGMVNQNNVKLSHHKFIG